jgi:hypothetical protein
MLHSQSSAICHTWHTLSTTGYPPSDDIRGLQQHCKGPTQTMSIVRRQRMDRRTNVPVRVHHPPRVDSAHPHPKPRPAFPLTPSVEIRPEVVPGASAGIRSELLSGLLMRDECSKGTQHRGAWSARKCPRRRYIRVSLNDESARKITD